MRELYYGTTSLSDLDKFSLKDQSFGGKTCRTSDLQNV